jgi:hypothetical protein
VNEDAAEALGEKIAKAVMSAESSLKSNSLDSGPLTAQKKR